MRLDGVAYSTETLDDVNSHIFNDLTVGTAHVLEVAATTSDGDSEFASLTLLLPPTLRTPTTTSSAIGLGWSAVTGATGYDLKLVGSSGTCVDDGVDAATSNLTYTFSSGLSASTAYRVCLRARNAQGHSAWTFASATTAAAPPPPKQLDSPTVDCLSSTDTGTHITWRTCCRSTTASNMLRLLVAADHNVVGIWMWDGSVWRLYARVVDQLVPGSINFSISGEDVLWLIAATSVRADGAWNPPPTPTAAELKRLAELAAQ